MSSERQPFAILQVSMQDLGGGAEGSAWNLFQVYRNRGHGSWLAVGHKRSTDPDVLEIPRLPQSGLWARVCWGLHRAATPLEGHMRGAGRLRHWLSTLAGIWSVIEQKMGREDFNFPGSRRLLHLPPRRPDIVHTHSLHGGYFDLRVLTELSRQVPVIVNLRDAWLLTGHCAHSFGCERWKTGCGRCPDLTIYPRARHDSTAYNWERKRRIYARSHLYVTAPSRWLLDMVRQSILRGFESKLIPNGIDLSIFCPGDRALARAKLQLPISQKIVLFAANRGRHNVFKDYATMKVAVRLAASNNPGIDLLFLCLGEKGEEQSLDQTRILFVGFERSPKQLALYYQAADVYIHAAKAEAFGKTITEALACGIPVVATAVGGIPEQIRDGDNGFLTPAGDPEAMAARIGQLLCGQKTRHLMGERAAEDARLRFGLDRQADAFLAWYQEVRQRFEAQRRDS